VQDDIPLVRGCGNVQEGDFIGTLFVVAAGNLDRIAGIAQVNEVGP